MRRASIDAASYRAAKRQAPWAAVIAKVEGGYLAFESITDYRTWRRQR